MLNIHLTHRHTEAQTICMWSQLHLLLFFTPACAFLAEQCELLSQCSSYDNAEISGHRIPVQETMHVQLDEVVNLIVF